MNPETNIFFICLFYELQLRALWLILRVAPSSQPMQVALDILGASTPWMSTLVSSYGVLGCDVSSVAIAGALRRARRQWTRRPDMRQVLNGFDLNDLACMWSAGMWCTALVGAGQLSGCDTSTISDLELHTRAFAKVSWACLVAQAFDPR